MASPALGYTFSVLLEGHAVDTYNEFVEANAEARDRPRPRPRPTIDAFTSDDDWVGGGEGRLYMRHALPSSLRMTESAPVSMAFQYVMTTSDGARHDHPLGAHWGLVQPCA